MSEWQDISTAPKTREENGGKHPTILVIGEYPSASEQWSRPIESWWLAPIGPLPGEWANWHYDFPPTHWMVHPGYPTNSAPAPSDADVGASLTSQMTEACSSVEQASLSEGASQ